MLCAAVTRDIAAAAAPTEDNAVEIVSEGFGSVHVSLDDLVPREAEAGTTAALIRGVAAGFAAGGLRIGGWRACIHSLVPAGGGLSSSAAFEILTGAIFSALYNGGRVDALTLARIGQSAERNYFGKPSGLMDQAASAFGGITKIDFADRERPDISRIAFDFRAHGYVLCAVNTHSRHDDLTPDYAAIAEHAKTATVVHIQRSRGYTQRNAFDLDTIQKVADTARKANPDVVIFVDNCYGEFTQIREPLSAGADVIAGSFIKNPGGGITPTGGYIAGKADLVEKISHRFTAPGIGKDLGCTQDSLRDTFLGFYYAPGVVCEALKTAVYAQCLLELVGVNPVPRYTADHNDIVTCFDSGSAAALQGFCAGIQSCSPVDSFVSPEPADEPGYTDQVIMASGSFTEGSTIEISCDGPLRAPYTCYLQGGVNFTAGRAAVLNAVQKAFFA